MSHHVDGEDGHQGPSVPVVSDPPSVVDLSDYVVQGVPGDLVLLQQCPSEDCTAFKKEGEREERGRALRVGERIEG